MRGLDLQKVIAKHKDSAQLYPLKDGGQVIGQEVDADNRLVYVIKRGEDIHLSFAEDEDPIQIIYHAKPHTKMITLPVATPGNPKQP